MPENSWRENDSYNELESIGSLLADLSDSEADSQFQPGEGRRRKAAVVLVVIWGGTIALHLVSWGYWFILGLTTLMGVHAVRILLARPLPLPEPLSNDSSQGFPQVSLLVAAKNEEAVIGKLVKMLCNLDYPIGCYELWVINDNSTDRTGVLLDHLSQQYDQLNVLHRASGSGGGKSGALNQVLPLTQGEIIAVFDADAQVPQNLLRRVLPLFQRLQVGAVQVRKSILQVDRPANFWLQGQMAEMALDSYFQQQRIAIGGIGELRGNGQFVRRAALERCGGWNEETITDDLDLTLRLHLDQWDIDFITTPAVEEEGVTQLTGLWHQRSRWAEGGYQRYLDYWQPLLRNRLGTRKTIDLFFGWVTQYVLPTAAVPDFLMTIARNRQLLLSPVTSLTLILFLLGMFAGLRRIQIIQKNLPQTQESPLSVPYYRFPLLLVTLLQTVRGTLYMFHWLFVVASTTARISIRPKRLKWIKTIHEGSGEVWIDVSEQPE